MEVPIPKDWLTAVCKILREGDRQNIFVRKTAWKDWQSLFPYAFYYDLFEALGAALSAPGITGKRIPDMREPGITYAFLFTHKDKPLYGKVCLQRDGKVLVIYSAHRRRKGDDL